MAKPFFYNEIINPDTRKLKPRDRLKALQKFLRSNSKILKDHWDYTTVVSFDSNPKVTKCGTVGCALGLYALMTGQYKIKTITRINREDYYDAIHSLIDGDNYYASKEFGITEEQVDEIFYTANSHIDRDRYEVTPKDVAKVIGDVLKGRL